VVKLQINKENKDPKGKGKGKGKRKRKRKKRNRPSIYSRYLIYKEALTP
jgi:hypothetical protein